MAETHTVTFPARYLGRHAKSWNGFRNAQGEDVPAGSSTVHRLQLDDSGQIVEATERRDQPMTATVPWALRSMRPSCCARPAISSGTRWKRSRRLLRLPDGACP